MEESSKINFKLNRFVFSHFILLFLVIYIGTLLKIVLPEKIQTTSVVTYLASVLPVERGEVAGASMGVNDENGLMEEVIKIPVNFVRNLSESLSF